MFGEGTNYTNINAPSSTADRTISCPDADGTFALKEINNNFSASQTIDNKAGTTTTVGVSSLALGNATAEGNDGNAKGRLLLYGKGTKYATLMATNVTANRSLELPNKDGTVALTSQLVKYVDKTVSVTIAANGIASKEGSKINFWGVPNTATIISVNTTGDEYRLWAIAFNDYASVYYLRVLFLNGNSSAYTDRNVTVRIYYLE